MQERIEPSQVLDGDRLVELILGSEVSEDFRIPLFTGKRQCGISGQELLSNRATGTYTTPDVCSMDTCTAPDAVSIGVNIEAVSATF